MLEELFVVYVAFFTFALSGNIFVTHCARLGTKDLSKKNNEKSFSRCECQRR